MGAAEDWSESAQPAEGGDQTWIHRKRRRPPPPVGSDEYPDLGYVTVSFEPGARPGEPGAVPLEALEALVAAAEAAFEADGLAIYVAAVLKPGMRDLLFYTRSAEAFDVAAGAFAAQWPQWRIAHAVFNDPLWTRYWEIP